MAVTGPVDPPQSRRRGKGYFLPGFIAMVALVGIGVFVAGAGDLQHRAPSTLAGSDIAAQIALGIQTQQNTARAPSVTCPPSEPVRSGFRFYCRLAGKPARTVEVTEVDSRGRVRWSLLDSRA